MTEFPPLSPPVRALLVGCGSVSNAWLTGAVSDPGIQIVGLVDLFPEAAQRQAEKYGLEVPHFTEVAEALAALKPEVVFDCSIPATHSPVACAAMEAGAHVLGEKPLSDTMEAARRSVETASRTGMTYAVMQNRRSETAARELRKLLDANMIGPVYAIYCDFFKAVYFSGFRAEMANVLLVDMAIHHFDIARYLSGQDAVNVYCLETNPPHAWPGFGPNAHAIFQMTENVTFNYSASWCAEGLETSWNAHWRVVGEFGTATWDGEGQIVIEAMTLDAEGKRQHTKTDYEIPVDPWPGPHGYVIRKFVRDIRACTEPETRAADNIKSLAMVFGAVASAGSGRVEVVEG